MTLDKYTPLKTHEVWHPRYSTYDVLVPKHRVVEHNRIRFTKAKSMMGIDYYFSGKKKWRVESNGTVDCVVIPLSDLQKLTINERSLQEVW